MPKAANNQTTTQTITNIFNIDFIDAAIGMYLLITPKTTPTSTKTRTIEMIDIIKHLTTEEINFHSS